MNVRPADMLHVVTIPIDAEARCVHSHTALAMLCLVFLRRSVTSRRVHRQFCGTSHYTHMNSTTTQREQ